MEPSLPRMRSTPSAPPSTEIVTLLRVTQIVESPTRHPAPTPTDHPVDERPWVVIVWNDPINLMSYVTLVLQRLFGYTKAKATRLMLQVHHEGKAVVSAGTREKAELDVSQLHAHGLWATMQQD